MADPLASLTFPDETPAADDGLAGLSFPDEHLSPRADTSTLTPYLDTPVVEGTRVIPLVPNEDEEAKKDRYVDQLFRLTDSPDRQVAIHDLSTRTGAPIDVVRDHFDAFKQSADAAQFNSREWRAANPELYDLLVERPHLAGPVFRDVVVRKFRSDMDQEALRLLPPAQRSTETVERQPFAAGQEINGPGAFVDALSRSVQGNVTGKMGAALWAAELGGTDSQSAKDLRDSILRRQQAAGSHPYYGGIGGTLGYIGEAVGGQADNVAGVAAGALAAAGAGIVSDSPEAAVAAFRATSLAVGAAAMFPTDLGQAYIGLRDAVDDNGKPIDVGVARAASLLYALGATTIGLWGNIKQLQFFQPVAESIQGAATREAAQHIGLTQIRALLRDAGTYKTLKTLGAYLGKHAGTDAAVGGLTESLKILEEWGAASASAGEAQSFNPADAISRIGSTAAMSATGSVVAGAGKLTAQSLIAAAQLRTSQVAATRAASVAAVSDSTSAQAAPTEIAKLVEVETARSGEPVTHLYVDPVRLADAIRTSGGDPNQAAQELMGPDGPQRLKEALAQRVDADGLRASLEVPVEEYYRTWGKHPLAQAIAEDITTRPGLMTARELSTINPAIGAKPGETPAPELGGGDEWWSTPTTDPNLATAQLEALRAGLATPWFRTPEEAGMTPEEWQAHREEIKASVTRAALSVERRRAQLEARTATSEWAKQVKANMEPAALQYDAQPASRAWAYVSRGQIVDESGALIESPAVEQGAWGKLDRDATTAILGPNNPLLKKISRRLVADGENPSDVAARFGFPDARTMFERMSLLPDRRAAVQAGAEQLTRDANPDLEQSMVRLNEVAQRALHTDESGGWFLKQYAILRKKAGGGGRTLEQIRGAARQLVDGMRIGRLSATQMLNRERAASEATAIENAKGNFPAALSRAQEMLVARSQFSELARAIDDRDALHELAGKLKSDRYRERLGQASPAHRDVVDSLLERLGLADVRPHEGPRLGLGDLESTMLAMGHIGAEENFTFDRNVVGSILDTPRDWHDLKVSEMREVLKALKEIKKSATLTNTIIHEGKRMSREAAVERVLADIDRNLDSRPGFASSASSATLLQRFGQPLSSIKARRDRPELMVKWLGGGVDSFLHRIVTEPLKAAEDYRNQLVKTGAAPLIEAMNNIPKEVRARLPDRIDGWALLPDHRTDILPPMNRLELINLARYRGEAGNIDRLTKGRSITLDQIDNALSLLTKPELDYVQANWDAPETLWQAERDLEERLRGVPPQKLKAVPFTLKLQSGETVHMRGGYFPAVYDHRIEQAGERQAARNQAELFDPRYVRPGTSHGHLKGRVEGFTGAVSLESAIIQQHILKAAHDVAFREPLTSVSNVLMDPRVGGAIKRTLSPDHYGQLLTWLKDIGGAVATQVDPHAGWEARALRSLKSNMITSTLGYAGDVFAADPTAVLTAVTRSGVGTGYAKDAVLDVLRSYGEFRQFGLQHSDELRTRSDKASHDLREVVRGLEVPQGALARANRAYKSHAFTVAEKIDNAVSTMIWLAKYRQAMDESTIADEAEAHARAVQHANSVVRENMPSHSVVDTAAVQRDKSFVGAMNMFTSYTNVIYNMWADLGNQFIEGPSRGHPSRLETGLRIAATASIVGALTEFIAGKGPEDDEGWFKWYLRKTALALISPVSTYAGDALEWAVLHREVSSRRDPLMSSIQYATKGIEKAMRHGTSGESAALEVAKAFGMPLGYPTRPIRALQYLANPQDRTAAGAVSGIVFGERKNQPLNPANVFSAKKRRARARSGR